MGHPGLLARMTSADDTRSAIIDPTKRVLQDDPFRTAVLIGSRVQGTATAESDVDLAVEFEPHLSSEERHRAPRLLSCHSRDHANA